MLVIDETNAEDFNTLDIACFTEGKTSTIGNTTNLSCQPSPPPLPLILTQLYRTKLYVEFFNF